MTRMYITISGYAIFLPVTQTVYDISTFILLHVLMVNVACYLWTRILCAVLCCSAGTTHVVVDDAVPVPDTLATLYECTVGAVAAEEHHTPQEAAELDDEFTEDVIDGFIATFNSLCNNVYESSPYQYNVCIQRGGQFFFSAYFYLCC